MPATDYLHTLANAATACLLAQTPITVTRHFTVERKGFPLPMKRVQPDADGNITQDYRPIVVLEWIGDTLLREAKEKLRAEQGGPAGDLDDLFGGEA